MIDINKYLWWIILNVIILTFRPSKTATAYKAIWNLDKDESPLKTYTRSQAEALEEDFKEVETFWSMRYGNPSISSVLKAMRDKGIDRILIFPLYPQYAAATTATVNDKVFEELSKMRWQPSIRTMPPFFDNPLYINALNSSVQKHIESLEWKHEILLTSYNGITKIYLNLGDRYDCHFHKQTRIMKE